MIAKGDTMPFGRFAIMKDGIPNSISTDDLFKDKKVVIFSVPGAFTPTCSKEHLPGFVLKIDDLKAKGVDTVACISVNDVFVMDAWGQEHHADDKVLLLADGNATYTKKLGLEMDATDFGMGLRGQRFAIIVDNGVVSELLVEEAGEFKVSSAEHILSSLPA